MTTLLHAVWAETFAPMLRTLSKLLDKGAQHASAKKFDSAVLVNARLAPDMYPLSRQVQIACDHAKNGVARLAGQEPPRFEDKEQTIDELKARIAKTLDFIESFRPAAVEGAENRDIKDSVPKNLVLEMKGFPYLRDWAFPHFYFHLVTAYDILRHNGVEIGKLDFMSHVGPSIRPAQRPKSGFQRRGRGRYPEHVKNVLSSTSFAKPLRSSALLFLVPPRAPLTRRIRSVTCRPARRNGGEP